MTVSGRGERELVCQLVLLSVGGWCRGLGGLFGGGSESGVGQASRGAWRRGCAMVVVSPSGRSAGEGWEGFQLGEGGCELGRPRPGVLEVELGAAAVEREPAGDVQQAVAQPLRFGVLKLAVEQ